MEPLETITLAVAIAGLIPLYIDLVNRRKEQQPHFRLTRIFGNRNEWVESKSGIIIESDKPIENCNITCGGIPLPCGKKKDMLQYQWYVSANEGALFDIPVNAEKEDAFVIIKSGKKKIGSPAKLRDISQE